MNYCNLGRRNYKIIFSTESRITVSSDDIVNFGFGYTKPSPGIRPDLSHYSGRPLALRMQSEITTPLPKVKCPMQKTSALYKGDKDDLLS